MSMEEFRKIGLDSSTENSNKKLTASSKKLPKKIIVILTALVVFIAFVFLMSFPARKVYIQAVKTQNQAKIALDALKKQDVETGSKELIKTKEELTQAQKDFRAFSFIKFIPFVNIYYSDAEHLIKAGFYGLDAGILLSDSIKPYADVLGLKGQGSFVMGSAEQRIQTAVMTMGKITPRIDDIVNYLVLAQKEIDSIDPNRYPSIFGGEKIKKQLFNLKTFTDEGVAFADQARPLIKVLPSLLGEKEEKKYLILFQNDKELRASGGFITAYSIFRIDRGMIHVSSSGDIYTLDNNLRVKTKAPEPILKYLPKVTTFNLRDSNLSPDFIESMNTFNSMYENVSGREKIDGIIALDTNVLVSIIKILDNEITVGGLTFNSNKDERCNCPQVIYLLEDSISRPVNYQKSGRKDLLGLLLYALMEKSLKSSPKVYWGPLFQDIIKEMEQKHVLVYLFDKEAQKGIDALNASGRLKAFDGDYLHINDSNMGGAKSNMYIKQNIIQSYEVKGDGSIVKTVTINYKNPEPPSDCNLERGGLCLNAILRDWIRIYVPKGSQLIDSKGSEVKMTSYEELGKTVFEGFLTVRPLGQTTFTISYRLPFKPSKGSLLPLMIQKQPGTYNNAHTIKIGDREVEKFELIKDKELKISL